MAGPGDTRILTEAELEEYAKDYHLLEDLSHYDFSNLDFDSDYFRSLPPAEQYSILNAARLRSRLRMGYSKEQLDSMFPDRLAFSRFQIQRLKERNDYTQRLMNLNGMNDVGPQRIAGEKGREYYLVRNEGGEGGWVLGVAGEGSAKEKPVLVDVENHSEEEEEDEEFEDVPLETSQEEEPSILKSLPLSSRKPHRQTKLPFTAAKNTGEGLFIVDEDEDVENVEDVEDVAQEMVVDSDDDPELQAAINLSMQPSQSQLSSDYHTQPIDLTQDSRPTTAISLDSELDRAIALSLAEERPMTSGSNKSDLQKALALSRQDKVHQTMVLEESDMDDDPEELLRRFPLTSKDKGKGKATSPTPEPPPSTGDDDLLKIIELSKEDYRLQHRQNGVGSSKDFEAVGESPSKAPILGRSMFRRKQPVAETKETSRPAPPVQRRETIEISEEPTRNKVLEEKIQQASPVSVPTATNPESVAQESTSTDTFEVELTPERTPINSPSKSRQSPLEQEPPSTPPSEHTNANEPPPSSQEEAYYLSSDEDSDLLAQLAAEAEEHARFATSINPSASSHPEDYNFLTSSLTEEDFEKEMRTLRNQQKKDRRDADEVNQLMVVECQQLLRLFGLPYVTAPMEAEAQCAELVRLGLVDGIVTDDSDIFLFGGTRVYKNMFNQGRVVECFLQSDLERDFNLDRGNFINLAHLLGSDYAEGVPHVGPVNALELLSEFPGERGLEEFREWWIAVQQGRAPKEAGETDFRRKFRKNSTKIFLPNDFPNRVIDQAYLHPEVDHDPQAFVWGIPDLDALRSFLMSQIGWSKERTDEILVPVIKDMNRRQVRPT